MLYDPKPFFLGGTHASLYTGDPSAQTAFMWHLLRGPVPSLGPTSAVSGAAGGGVWVVGRWVAAWEFPQLVWGGRGRLGLDQCPAHAGLARHAVPLEFLGLPAAPPPHCPALRVQVSQPGMGLFFLSMSAVCLRENPTHCFSTA